MRIELRLIIVIISCMIIYLGINAVNTIGHENAHLQVDNYSYISSHIEYSFLMISGKVIPDNNQTVPASLSKEYFMLHSLNEIVGYNVQSILLFMTVITGLLIWRELK